MLMSAAAGSSTIESASSAPTAIPFIESLVNDRLIRGWRDVRPFEPFDNKEVRA